MLADSGILNRTENEAVGSISSICSYGVMSALEVEAFALGAAGTDSGVIVLCQAQQIAASRSLLSSNLCGACHRAERRCDSDAEDY